MIRITYKESSIECDTKEEMREILRCLNEIKRENAKAGFDRASESRRPAQAAGSGPEVQAQAQLKFWEKGHRSRAEKMNRAA
jgi:hypothetical protein